MTRPRQQPPATWGAPRAAGGPGSNPRDHLGRADWRFLVPGIQNARVLLLGPPTAGELSSICAAASRVVVAVSEPGQVADIRDAATAEGVTGLHLLQVSDDDPLPFPPDAFDLVAFPGGLSAGQLTAPTPLHRDIGRVLAAEGKVYLETRVPLGGVLARQWARRCVDARAETWGYWTVWRKGSMRAAIPIEDAPELAGYFFRSALYGKSRAGRLLTRAAKLLARVRLLHRALWMRSTVVAPSGAGDRPFSYVRQSALRHGHDMEAQRIALLTHGAYDSNKNAFFVFERGSRNPKTILKMTRTPAFNYRLEREHRALQALHSGGFVAPGTYPEAVFLEEHEGLALLAEKVVPGRPFRTETTGKADCPIAQRAVDWIVGLGARSAVVGPGNREHLSSRLEAMLERLHDTYGLAEDRLDFLAGELESFRDRGLEIPTVFRHGDAGTWNMLVTSEGAPAFLDWELGEPAGPPLWDLIDFTRSFGNWMARLTGEREPVSIYRRIHSEQGPAFEFQLAAVQRYLADVGLPQADVKPLYYFYWVDRALRQAAWATESLNQAPYIRLLRASIDLRGSPALGRLFGASRATAGPNVSDAPEDGLRAGDEANMGATHGG